MKISELKLFIVEFGKPDIGNSYSFGGIYTPLFVLAKSYDEAAEKGLNYYIENSEKSVLTSDGSINSEALENLKVKNVKIATENIIY